MKRLLVLMVLLLCGCTQNLTDPAYTHLPIFTLPFARSVEMYVWEHSEDAVEIHAAHFRTLRAPTDGTVLDARVGSLAFKAFDQTALLVMDGVENVDVDAGESYCGGDPLGSTRSVRLRAYWAKEVDPDQSDLSMVRILRHSTVTDLSDVRFADPISSALWTVGGYDSATNVNGPECPYERLDEEE